MSAKLTVPTPVKAMRLAEQIGKRLGISPSELIVELIEREAERLKDPFAELRGIWVDNPVTAEELRERAW